MGHLKHSATGHLLHGPNGHLVDACADLCTACLDTPPATVQASLTTDTVKCSDHLALGLLNVEVTMSRITDLHWPCCWRGSTILEGTTYYYELFIKAADDDCEWWFTVYTAGEWWFWIAGGFDCYCATLDVAKEEGLSVGSCDEEAYIGLCEGVVLKTVAGYGGVCRVWVA